MKYFISAWLLLISSVSPTTFIWQIPSDEYRAPVSTQPSFTSTQPSDAEVESFSTAVLRLKVANLELKLIKLELEVEMLEIRISEPITPPPTDQISKIQVNSL